MTGARRIGIVGGGSIGVAFAVQFARAGWDVGLTDVDDAALTRAQADLDERLRLLAEAGRLGDAPEDVAARIALTRSLPDAVRGAALVQECAPERIEIKRAVLADIAASALGDAVIASSTSALLPSTLAADLLDEAAARVIVGHPGNPPYLLPVIEIVPSPRTARETVARARDAYASTGLRPVVVRTEIEGFVFNRLQGALLREAYCLVRDGIVDVEDVDEIVRSGLGRRWSIIGPFETVDLNTRGGIASHAEKMGSAYERMGAERGQHDPWTPDLVARVTAQRRRALPLEEWPDRVRWRDEQLLAHTALWDGDVR